MSLTFDAKCFTFLTDLLYIKHIVVSWSIKCLLLLGLVPF